MPRQRDLSLENGKGPHRSHRTFSDTLKLFVVVGSIGVTALVLYLLGFLTEFHGRAQVTLPEHVVVGGAPMPAAPESLPQSQVLSDAAETRRVSAKRVTDGMRAHSNRTAGPFHNLPGKVGTVRFEYPDVQPEVSSAYPPTTSLLDIIENWNPDDVDAIPDPFMETLQVFNYSNPEQRAMAEKYRNAELPFKIFAVPEIDAVTQKWTDAYLTKNMHSKNMHFKVEESKDNHFMYWTNRGRPRGFTPPTKHVSGYNYERWLKIAHDADTLGIDPSEKHLYLMTGVEAGRIVARDYKRHGQFISRDLPLFSTTKNNFFITAVNANKGIQCRFGMKGVIAEAHYDGGRNMVAMLKGAKRYIISPPSECEALQIIKDRNHPSYRHSTADWSNRQEAEAIGFGNVQGIDTVVREGEILYIPSYWFHYIISLDYSIQCNSRSGSPPSGHGEREISQCMKSKSTEGKKGFLRGQTTASR